MLTLAAVGDMLGEPHETAAGLHQGPLPTRVAGCMRFDFLAAGLGGLGGSEGAIFERGRKRAF